MGKHLDRLGDGNSRVLDIEKLPDGNFRLWEECDHYFYVDFTAEELRELAAELVALSNGESK
jgi:hypothetical protein